MKPTAFLSFSLPSPSPLLRAQICLAGGYSQPTGNFSSNWGMHLTFLLWKKLFMIFQESCQALLSSIRSLNDNFISTVSWKINGEREEKREEGRGLGIEEKGQCFLSLFNFVFFSKRSFEGTRGQDKGERDEIELVSYDRNYYISTMFLHITL